MEQNLKISFPSNVNLYLQSKGTRVIFLDTSSITSITEGNLPFSHLSSQATYTSGSNSNASTQKNRDLQLENVRYREEIASLRASLNEKDVMIEHLTKIVEGFQSKVPEDVTDSHNTNAKAHVKGHVHAHAHNRKAKLRIETNPQPSPVKESVEVKLSDSMSKSSPSNHSKDSPLRYFDPNAKDRKTAATATATATTTNVPSSPSLSLSSRVARQRRERRRTKLPSPRDSSVEPVRMRESTGNTNAFTKRGTITTPTASTSTQGKNENDRKRRKI